MAQLTLPNSCSMQHQRTKCYSAWWFGRMRTIVMSSAQLSKIIRIRSSESSCALTSLAVLRSKISMYLTLDALQGLPRTLRTPNTCSSSMTSKTWYRFQTKKKARATSSGSNHSYFTTSRMSYSPWLSSLGPIWSARNVQLRSKNTTSAPTQPCFGRTARMDRKLSSLSGVCPRLTALCAYVAMVITPTNWGASRYQVLPMLTLWDRSVPIWSTKCTSPPMKRSSSTLRVKMRLCSMVLVI